MEWESESRGAARIAEITRLAKASDRIYLATDPDREGEAISWHVKQVLDQKRAIKGAEVKRVVFHEITKSAVLNAIANPRDIKQDLVDAYLARRALDYLVGFTLSPVLWRKLPGSRSAGRVQSVSLRLICEREAEIESFVSQEYWSIAVDLKTLAGDGFTSRLTTLDGKKLDRLSLKNADEATAAKQAVEAASLSVQSVEKKQAKRHPAPPFTTSTLQQEASRKLGFSASRTMQIAQRLYEGADLGGETVGLITYMRTDSVALAGEAIGAIRKLIGGEFGDRYLPGAPRTYKSKAANAQEAHEAIRPTDVRRHPRDLARVLDHDQLRLYELIWKRTVACQMESAILDQVVAEIAGGRVGLRATGSTLNFDGFLRLYQEGRDDAEDEEGGLLPPLKQGEAVVRTGVRPEQHFTQPPPRYTEASLVKKMEELGIGRPSTYASILQVLQDRDYVTLDQKRFIPADRGRIVTAFLASFFERYVRYDFTAQLENQLDDISEGKIDWREVMRQFWQPFTQAIDGTKELTITQVIEALDRDLGAHFFPEKGDGKDPRLCPSCQSGRLGLKLGKTGGFIGCSKYPDCRYTRTLSIDGDEGGEGAELAAQPKLLGDDPVSGLPVTLRKGPYGIYVQLGEAVAKGDKPRRASLTKEMSPADITLEQALSLLSLPRDIGAHPETGEPLTVGIGRFGPYIKRGDKYVSLPKGEDVLSLGLNRAVVLLAEAAEKSAGRGRAARPEGRVIGAHPGGLGDIVLHDGRYGPYVELGKARATLPKGVDPTALTPEEAAALLAPKIAAAGPAKKTAPRKAPAAKAAGKTTAAKAAGKTATAKAAGETAAAKKPAARKTAAKTADDAAAAPKKTTRPRKTASAE
jgi:DNA topoisomerase-1